MDIFIGIITKNFHTGSWTDQEIGYAYRKGVPRLSIRIIEDNQKVVKWLSWISKVFRKKRELTPQGFISSEQTSDSSWDNAHIKIIEYLKELKLNSKNQEGRIINLIKKWIGPHFWLPQLTVFLYSIGDLMPSPE